MELFGLLSTSHLLPNRSLVLPKAVVRAGSHLVGLILMILLPF
jgi:hypothetical protein